MFIIAFICCIALSGCGYKTAPVYVADSNVSQEHNTTVVENNNTVEK